MIDIVPRVLRRDVVGFPDILATHVSDENVLRHFDDRKTNRNTADINNGGALRRPETIVIVAGFLAGLLMFVNAGPTKLFAMG